jgi:serine/threonine protein kinase
VRSSLGLCHSLDVVAGGKRVEATEVMSGDDIGKALRVGRYRVEKKIGQGGMADIFLARAEGPGGFDKQVVIKKIRAQLGRNHKFVEMFLREARLLATLDHPNIVRIIELGEQEGEYFLALEYLEGLPLRDVVERFWHAKRSLPLETLLRCMQDSARGLEHAHNFKDARGHPANLVHRDVSPDNLFVTTSGPTKVLDFGIAKREGIDMLTQAGEIKGKIPFMSPEALQGYPLDRRCDIWSMGVILYWMCAGKRPFDGASDLHTMKAVLEDEPQPIREINPKVPKQVDDLIRACLQKDRDKRMKTAGALVEALGKVIALARTVPPPELLVLEAMKLEGVEWEVRPKGDPVVPAADWKSPVADPTTLPPSIPPGDPEGTFVADVAAVQRELNKGAAREPRAKELGSKKDLAKDASKDASKDATSKIPTKDPPSSKSNPSKRGRGAVIEASPSARVRKLDLDSGEIRPAPNPQATIAEMRPDLLPSAKKPEAKQDARRTPDKTNEKAKEKAKDRQKEKPPKLPKDASWEGPSLPSLDVERVPASDFNQATDENIPARTSEESEEPPRKAPPAPMFQIASAADVSSSAPVPQKSSGPMAALLGVGVALVVATVAVFALGLHKQVLARVGLGPDVAVDGGEAAEAASDAGEARVAVADAGAARAGVVDAGTRAAAAAIMGTKAADAGPESSRKDAGIHFEEIDAGVAPPGAHEVLRTVELIAPDHVEWRNVSGESLFSGTAETRVSLAEEEVLALDTRRGCTMRVVIKGKRRIDFSTIPRGRLMVKGKKGTDVFLGSEKVATVPMKSPLDLPAGSCELRTKLKGDEQKQPIEIKPNRTLTIAIR